METTEEHMQLLVPENVQITITEGADDRLHVKFNNSTSYERRQVSSSNANPLSGGFFCFDYLGEDSLKSDLLAFKSNYWPDQRLEQEIVINLSKRGSTDNSVSRHAINSSVG